MRKTVLLLLLGLLTYNTDLFAQRKVTFGLTASPLISWMKGDNTNIEKGKIKVGLEYGLLMDINFSENYAIHTGLVMMMQGGNLNYADSILFIPKTRVTYKFQYFQIPTTMKLKTNQIGYITYFGEFGVVSAFRIRARADGDKASGTDLENENIIKDNNPFGFTSNFFNLSLRVGGGVEWNFAGNTALIFGIIYDNGFVNLINDNDDDKILINSLMLRAAIQF